MLSPYTVSLRFPFVKTELRALGITITRKPATGEYRVNFRDGLEATAYYTQDLEDALNTGRTMATYL